MTGSANSTTPSSGREAPFGLDLPSADIEPLGAMFDVPTDFDWVWELFRIPFSIQSLKTLSLIERC
jgi:hypothetical protein